MYSRVVWHTLWQAQKMLWPHHLPKLSSQDGREMNPPGFHLLSFQTYPLSLSTLLCALQSQVKITHTVLFFTDFQFSLTNGRNWQVGGREEVESGVHIPLIHSCLVVSHPSASVSELTPQLPSLGFWEPFSLLVLWAYKINSSLLQTLEHGTISCWSS